MNTCILLVIATIVFKTSAQDLPHFLSTTGPNSVNSSDYDGDDAFKEEVVVEYSENESDTIDKIHNKSSEISQRSSIASSKPTVSKDFNFDDWDLMNDDETTLYAEYNQTIIIEMKQKQYNGLNSITTPSPLRFTTPLKTLELNPDIFEAPHDAATLELDLDIFKPEEPEIPEPTSTPTPTSSAMPHDAATLLELGENLFENEEAETPTPTSLPTTTQVTTELVNSTDDSYSIENSMDNSIDYDSKEIMNDPCNYEKFSHPLPPIEKNGRRVSDIKCEEYMWYYKLEVLDVEKNRKECKEKMKKQKQSVTEIFGGLRALQGDFPHMGAVGWILQTGDIKWMCGSSLISPRFTLTAAHCRRAPHKLKLHRKNREPELVRFGSVFLDNKIVRNLFAEDVYIAEFLVLEEYAKNPNKKYNDIALIRLATEVQMKLFIKPACLWTQFLSLGNSWTANITGWGKTSYVEGSESNYLKYAEVDYVEQGTCRRYIHGRRNRHWPDGLKDHQICAGKLQGGIDACQGDSGGPLQILTPKPAHMNSTGEIHHVVGVTSFGVKCGYPFLPGVYTKVADFLCWIEKNVWPEENNPLCP